MACLAYIVDELTGEIVGVKTENSIETPEDAEWVMERLSEIDGEIAALNARKAAILENIDVELKRIQRRRDGLLYKYEGELVAFAKENLSPGKKSWTSPYGTVQFRTNPARLKVADEEKALAWAKAYQPEAVQVKESFLISKIDAEWKENLMKAPMSDREERGFDIAPESESHTVSTGVR